MGRIGEHFVVLVCRYDLFWKSLQFPRGLTNKDLRTETTASEKTTMIRFPVDVQKSLALDA